MCGIMPLVNFFWAAIFFLAAIIAAGFVTRKLQGRVQWLMLVIAVTVAIGTGFCMMGQFWIDMFRVEHGLLVPRHSNSRVQNPGNVPVADSHLSNELDRLARVAIADHGKEQEGMSDKELTLDWIRILEWDIDGRCGFVALQYKIGVADREAIVDCRRLVSGEWRVARIQRTCDNPSAPVILWNDPVLMKGSPTDRSTR